jgi:uncharacterized surface protein with fasciclin (FAS1) repeats
MRPYPRRIAVGLVVAGLSFTALTACTKEEVSPTSAAAGAASTTAAAAPAGETTTTTATDAVSTTAAAAGTKTAAGPMLSASTEDIFYTAVAAGSFLTLARLLVVSDLLETIKGTGPFTVFAPTDAAFAAVPPATLKALIADKAKLQKVLLYHVVPGRLLAADLKNGANKTAEGSMLQLTRNAGALVVNDANVAAADVKASNGVVHVIDKVLIPPDL